MWVSGSDLVIELGSKSPNPQNHLAAQIYSSFNFDDHIFTSNCSFLLEFFSQHFVFLEAYSSWMCLELLY